MSKGDHGKPSCDSCVELHISQAVLRGLHGVMNRADHDHIEKCGDTFCYDCSPELQGSKKKTKLSSLCCEAFRFITLFQSAYWGLASPSHFVSDHRVVLLHYLACGLLVPGGAEMESS